MNRRLLKYVAIILISGGMMFGFAGNVISQGPPPPPPPPPPSTPPPPPAPPSSATLMDTKHNLSVSGPGTIKALAEERLCIFCHTPHNARRDVPYLWNRQDSTANYTPYQSTTLFATVGQPTGASKLCLSCHDGTIALGAIKSGPEIVFAGGIRFLPAGHSNLGTDLSDDHPISFVYDDILAVSNGELLSPSVLPQEIRLDNYGQMQCTSCHDPHSNINGQFLVLPNDYSTLCTACHQKTGWSASSHSISSAVWNGSGSDPWPHTSYATVAENGCENCHRPHTAGHPARLLNYIFEEDNCLVCHNGNVATASIEAELLKPYIHPVQNYVQVHDEAEDFTSSVQKHVECVDCHNPHVANNSPSPGAPEVSGATSGVSGISAGGQQITTAVNQYEICYKCHGASGNNVITSYAVDRQLPQLDTSLEFNVSNPSFHPVEVQGVNSDVPSLLPPYTTSSLIFCTDCHNNDDQFGPSGPHGSYNRFILSENYTVQDYTQENAYNYALCYKCHDRNSILNDQSFKEHRKHIVKENAPCAACHDPHGISSTQGNSVNNSHLINFDISYVLPNSQGLLMFEDLGRFTGRCYLTCHGKDHNPKQYP